MEWMNYKLSPVNGSSIRKGEWGVLPLYASISRPELCRTTGARLAQEKSYIFYLLFHHNDKKKMMWGFFQGWIKKDVSCDNSSKSLLSMYIWRCERNYYTNTHQMRQYIDDTGCRKEGRWDKFHHLQFRIILRLSASNNVSSASRRRCSLKFTELVGVTKEGYSVALGFVNRGS